MRHASGLSTVFLLLVLITPAAEAGKAATELRTSLGRTPESSERIVVDGRLDEEIWSRAIPAAGFIR